MQNRFPMPKYNFPVLINRIGKDGSITHHHFFLLSRAAEREQKLIEEETARRVEGMVAKRVEEEIAKRKDEIDSEVLRRVEEAKQIMEKQMLEEFEKRRQEHLEEQQIKEVMMAGMVFSSFLERSLQTLPLLSTKKKNSAKSCLDLGWQSLSA